jgi:hypothetical protein
MIWELKKTGRTEATLRGISKKLKHLSRERKIKNSLVRLMLSV